MARPNGRLVAFGEAMLREMPDRDGVIRQTPGGAEWNVAVATARLGRPASWVSSVPADPNGWSEVRMVAEDAGVDLTGVVTLEDAEIGRYRVEPDAQKVVYDRADSAFARLDRSAFDWRELLDGARWLVTSGITPLLGEGPRAAWSTALAFSELEGVLNAFDLNHRPILGDLARLWGDVVQRIRQFHVVVLSSDSIDGIAAIEGWDMPSDDDGRIEVMERIRLRSLLPHLCCCFKSQEADGSQRRWSAVAHSFGIDDTREDAVIHEPIDPLGGGDAWLAGYLDGLTQFGHSPDSAKRAASRGDHLAVLSQSTFGDACEANRSRLLRAEERSVGSESPS